jgi:amino acid transporter
MAIYVHRNEEQLGPYTVAEVKSQLTSGALSLHDHVWWKGQKEWVPLRGSPVLRPGFKDPEDAPVKKEEGPAGISSFSIAAVVAGLLFPLSFFTSLPAILFGHCALSEIKKNPRRTGRRLAIVGLCLGYFFTLVNVVAVGCWIYFYKDIQKLNRREIMVNSDVFVPPVQKKNLAPTAKPAPPPAPKPATNAAPSNLDQPLAPGTGPPNR